MAGGVVWSKVEADNARWPALVDPDAFNAHAPARHCGGGEGADIVVHAKSDERARSQRQGPSRAQQGRRVAESLDAGEDTRTLLARRCARPRNVGNHALRS